MRPEPVREGLRRFFTDNPDEELTMEDAVVKFGVTPSAIYLAVSQLGNMIERVHTTTTFRRAKNG